MAQLNRDPATKGRLGPFPIVSTHPLNMVKILTQAVVKTSYLKILLT